MAGYIDGFVFAVAEDQLEQYQRVATAVAEIYREHGASNYVEFVGDDLRRDGTRSFTELVSAAAGEAVIFGWVEFEGREARDRVNALVAADPRMEGLVAPLLDPANRVFDAEQMCYAGFRPLVAR